MSALELPGHIEVTGLSLSSSSTLDVTFLKPPTQRKDTEHPKQAVILINTLQSGNHQFTDYDYPTFSLIEYLKFTNTSLDRVFEIYFLTLEHLLLLVQKKPQDL